MSYSEIKGVIVPIITPLSKSGDLDTKSLKKLVDYLIKSGAHGIWASGTTGEFANLTKKQRLHSIEKIIEYVDNKIPVIANIACAGTQESIDFGKSIVNLNPTGIATTPPFYYLNNQKEIFDHYQYISDELNTQLWVYNIPSTVKNEILPNTTLKLAKEKTIIGIKDSGGILENIANLSISVKRSNIKMNLFIGSNFMTTLTEGILVDGVIPGLANLIPNSFAKAWESGLSQKDSGLKKYHDEIVKGTTIINLGKNQSVSPIACIKAGLMHWRVIESDKMTKPFETLNDDEKQKMRNLINDLSI